jgi:hypothetical protein
VPDEELRIRHPPGSGVDLAPIHSSESAPMATENGYLSTPFEHAIFAMPAKTVMRA